MKKVFIIHGFEGSPNGGWRPWLMAELEKRDVYACALPMPTPENPLCPEWVYEIEPQIVQNKDDEIYLVGHSLGGPAILRFLEQHACHNIGGVVLVSSPAKQTKNTKLESFFKGEFDFEKIKKSVRQFAIIHGDNDPLVPMEDAQFLSQLLGADLLSIKNGGHLNGSAGFFTLPECLQILDGWLS